MYLRLLQLKVKPDLLSAYQNYYDEKVVKALQKIPGCLYANLMQSTHAKDECISMTLWESPRQAEEYEQSGPFQDLVEDSRPYFVDSTEWKIQLSKDFKLEYEPVTEEPVVKAYDVAAKVGTEPSASEKIDRMFVRIVTAKIIPEKREESIRIYTTEIMPVLQKVKGCRYVYLTEGIQDPTEAISITIWDRKEDADAYEASGLFEKLRDKLKHTFAGLYQWKMALEKETRGQVATSEDLEIKHYSIVAGKSFH